MTVAKLIKTLQALNKPNAKVTVRGYEHGVSDAGGVELIRVREGANEECVWWAGAHEPTTDADGVERVHIYAGPRRASRRK